MAVQKIGTNIIDSGYTTTITTNPEFSGTEAARMPSGTTAQRANAQAGDIRFNTTINLMEYYDGTLWKAIDAPPVVTGISPSSIVASDSSFEITISGSNFQSGATVKAIGQDLSEISAGTVIVSSPSQITATFNGTTFVNAQENYDIKITNNSGLTGTLDDALAVNATPIWTVASGSLGTILDYNRTGVSITTGATDPDGNTLTYAVASGSLPAGLSLNTSNGTISGNATAVSADTTSTFTLSVTDGNNTATREYSITIQAPALFVTVLSNITNSSSYTLNSASASPIFILDPADPNCDNGSSSTLTQLGSGSFAKNGTLNSMNRVGSNRAKYWQFQGGSTSDIDFGTTQNGYTNDSTDVWAYCGWWYMAANPRGAAGSVWVLNDGDWSPFSQIGIRYGQGSETSWKIHSGGTANLYTGSLRADINAGDWIFMAVWHKVSGGLFVADAKATDSNLNVYVNNSTSSSIGNAASLPLVLGSRPDARSSERTTNDFGMGPQAFWAIVNPTAMSASQSDAASMFETIFDRTKTRYA